MVRTHFWAPRLACREDIASRFNIGRLLPIDWKRTISGLALTSRDGRLMARRGAWIKNIITPRRKSPVKHPVREYQAISNDTKKTTVVCKQSSSARRRVDISTLQMAPGPSEFSTTGPSPSPKCANSSALST